MNDLKTVRDALELPPCTSFCQNSDNSNGICRGCFEREKTSHGILLNIAKRMTADSCVDYPKWLFTLIEEAIKLGETTLDRLSAPVGVPDGFKLVPIEPTEEMFDAGFEQYKRDELNYDKVYVGDIYKAMLSAAPTPATNLQKDVNLADGVNDCKFEKSAPTEIDLDELKREVIGDICKHYNRATESWVRKIIDHLSRHYDFVRKV